MKKSILIPILFIVFVGFSSFGLHKFYMSIYQVDYNSGKKMLQITSRIFIDDLNTSLYKNFNQKIHIGEENETPNDIILMKKYISEHFIIKVNGQPKTINFLSKELDGNVVVCYFSIKDIGKIKTMEIKNTALFDLNGEQQNIIQTNILGNKQSFLLTSENNSGVIKL